MSAPRIDSVELEYTGGLSVVLMHDGEEWMAEVCEDGFSISYREATEQELRDAGLWVSNAEPLTWEGDNA